MKKPYFNKKELSEDSLNGDLLRLEKSIIELAKSLSNDEKEKKEVIIKITGIINNSIKFKEL